MKIGFLITARLKSSRLPFKVLKDLNGRTVIERIIDRAREVMDTPEIILCTSINPQDKPLIETAKNNNIYYFAGDEEDVLKRLLDASKLFNLDYFVSITADNPLIDIYHANLVVNEIKTGNYDFIKIEGLPLGSAVSGMRVKALETVCEIKKIKDTEIWGYLIRPEIFNIKTIKASGKLNRPELRFTVDYEEDCELMRNIHNNVPFKNVLNLYDVIEYLDKNPDVSSLNSSCIQMDLDEKTKKEIEEEYTKNLDKIRKIKDEIYLNNSSGF